MQNIKLIRKRYIPDEIVDISGDEIIFKNEEVLVTNWKPIHHRTDVKYGISYAHFNKGFKIAKLFNNNDEFMFYYCDIMQYEFNKDKEELTEIDLLIDILVYDDGKVKVVDLDELAKARREGLITEEQLLYALEKANDLLNIIYQGKFKELVDIH